MDRLFVEEEIEPSFFDEVLRTRELTIAPHTSVKELRKSFESILVSLGYHDPNTPITSILEKVSEVTERPVKSFEFLVVKPQ